MCRYIYIYRHVHTMVFVSKLEDNLWEPLISTTWVLGMELGLSGLVISAIPRKQSWKTRSSLHIIDKTFILKSMDSWSR